MKSGGTTANLKKKKKMTPPDPLQSIETCYLKVKYVVPGLSKVKYYSDNIIIFTLVQWCDPLENVTSGF